MTPFSSLKTSMFRSALVLSGVTFFLAVVPSLAHLTVDGAGQKPSAPAGVADLSGTINYCANPAPPGTPTATVTATGSDVFMTTTNSSGDYTFTDLPTGTYTISVSKPAILTPAVAGIDTIDISRLLTHLADPPNSTLTNCQKRAADTSANGLINTTDLTNLLSYVALSSPTVNNHTGEWRFCKSGTTGPPGGSCSPTDLINLLSDTTGRDFDAILLGEISGDWTPAGPAPDAITTALGAGKGSTSVSTQAASESNPVPNIVTPVPLTLPTTTVVAPI
ncbi:MAG TPA: carboxypeptidase regulatory-like domain-containing protein, partial [Blastocatellia bacterium]|nr:carboxypeptidase regulatory-like domain-containing protein [Blastocatellia bacterium]